MGFGFFRFGRGRGPTSGLGGTGDSTALFNVTRSATSSPAPSTYSSNGEKEHTHNPNLKYQFQNTLWTICSILGLTFIYHFLAKILSWNPRQEEPKVAMTKSRTIALLRGFVHIIPMSGCIVLIYLNSSSYYIGGELSGPDNADSQKIAGLQFAAKIHEIFMVTSLGLVIVTHIRRELMMGDGLPFGAMFLPSGFQQVSFLWSPAFGGICFQDWQSKRRKCFSIIMIIVCSLLALSVGPSSATLMRPRLGEWPAGGTGFWMAATADQLIPPVIEKDRIPSVSSKCGVESGDLECPSGNWRALEEMFFNFWPQLDYGGNMPVEVQVQGLYSQRVMHVETRAPGTAALFRNAYTMATAPMTSLADGMIEMGRMWCGVARYGTTLQLRRSVNFALPNVQQPAVYTRCIRTPLPYTESLQVTGDVEFPVISTIGRFMGKVHVGKDMTVLNTTAAFNLSTSINNMLSSPRPAVNFLDDPTILSTLNASLAAIITIPPSINPDRKTPHPSDIFACSILSAYGPSTYRARFPTSWQSSNVVDGYPPNFEHGGMLGVLNTHYTPFNISASWAALLNPVHPLTNSSALSSILKTAGLWNTTTPLSSPLLREPAVESILSVLLTNGISRIGYRVPRIGHQLIDDLLMLPKGAKGDRLGPGRGDIFRVPDNAEKASRWQFEAGIEGYAYTPYGVQQIATMGVLGLYLVLVLAHFAWTVVTGWSSGGWGTPHEVAALALRSKRTGCLENVGGGVETARLFEERVRLRVDGEDLEMVFDDTEREGMRAVVENERYG